METASLTSGPVGGDCDECDSPALHAYWRDGTGKLACAEHACTVLHDAQPTAEGIPAPLWCPGCNSWVAAP